MTDLLFPGLVSDAGCHGSAVASHGVLACWLVADGSRVQVDQPVAEVRVRATTGLIRALATGTLWHQCPAGETLMAGVPVAVIE